MKKYEIIVAVILGIILGALLAGCGTVDVGQFDFDDWVNKAMLPQETR